jgi:hypothetical protein
MIDCKYCRTTPNNGEVSCASMTQARDCPWMSKSDWDWLDRRERTKRPQAAIDNLTNHQEQCDADGCMIKVSRQALDEVLAYLDATSVSRPHRGAVE